MISKVLFSALSDSIFLCMMNSHFIKKSAFVTFQIKILYTAIVTRILSHL